MVDSTPGLIGAVAGSGGGSTERSGRTGDWDPVEIDCLRENERYGCRVARYVTHEKAVTQTENQIPGACGTNVTSPKNMQRQQHKIRIIGVRRTVDTELGRLYD